MTLNELVAVAVMGYTAIAQTDGINSKSGGTYYCNDRLYWFEDDYGLLQRPYKPSTWIGDAWEVVEKMKERGTKQNPVEFTLVTPYRPKNSDQTMPFWARFRINGIDGKAKGDDPARTICLAALRAVGVSEERISQATKEVAR